MKDQRQKELDNKQHEKEENVRVTKKQAEKQGFVSSISASILLTLSKALQNLSTGSFQHGLLTSSGIANSAPAPCRTMRAWRRNSQRFIM
jgi:hypothetical protein